MLKKVAVIGAGYFAQFHLEAWQRLSLEGRCEFVAVVDRDEMKVREASERFGVQGFSSIDAMQAHCNPTLIDIATPPETHFELVSWALEKSIPAICQKPVAPTFEQALLLSEQVLHGQTPVWIHENFRWMPWYREMRKLIDAGVLGNLHDVAFRLRPGDGQGESAYLARQPYFQGMKRFLVHETLIHLIDTYRYLMGEIVAVSAHLRRVNPVIAGEDAGYVIFKFASGATGLIDANRLNDHNADNTRLTMGEAWLAGDKGIVRLDGYGQLYVKPHLQPEVRHSYDWESRGFGGDAVYLQQRHVLNALEGKEVPINLIDAYMANVKIEEAVYESDAQRCEVEI